MELRRVHVDDVVVCEVRGARFRATVRDRRPGRLCVRVIERGQLPRGMFIDDVAEVTARQVVRRERSVVSA